MSPTKLHWGSHSVISSICQVKLDDDVLVFSSQKCLPVRMMIFSFLMMYGRTNFFVSVGLVLAFSNLLLAFIILRTKPYKNFFTAFGGESRNMFIRYLVTRIEIFPAIVLPGAIFFSKDSFHSRKDTQQRFQTFSYWNSLTFLLVGKAPCEV